MNKLEEDLLEIPELELFGNKMCCQFSQYFKHIPSHDIIHNLVPRFVYSMKPPHHQNNGQTIKKYHKRTIVTKNEGANKQNAKHVYIEHQIHFLNFTLA